MKKKDLTLLIMAAGMGSRFGGLKQIEPMGPNGEFLIDYSVYDAINAGFNKVVFIIKEENYGVFKDTIGKRVEDKVKTEYVFQDINDLPNGYTKPEGREKPWGTAHAILCAKDNIHEPFVIINADDFYGKDAYIVASNFLKSVKDGNNYCLVGYKVANTLTENGAVKRGVCKLENGNLTELIESNVEKIDGKIIAKPLDGRKAFEVTEDTYVSMNMLCFTPTIFKYIEKRFPKFLEDNKDNILQAEYLIPDLLERLTLEGISQTIVLPTDAKWEGITYKEDKDSVVKSLKLRTEDGEYPHKLWN
ncbi:MAG: nucleotidyltransferase [Bacilli bacterium]|nr:nucleotidyltransferase [Bacilli bacterium]